jgi:predicted nucleic acid-binding protein
MGLREAVRHVPMSKWLEAIQAVTLQNPKLDETMRDRLNQGLAELLAVAEYLESQS